MAKVNKVPVGERAMLARLNRRLGSDGLAVKSCREDSKAFEAMGRYYQVDAKRNIVTATHLDIEKLAREMGLMEAWEKFQK